MADEAKRWAKRQVLAELRELRLDGFASNVQEWHSSGKMKRPALNAARRSAAKKLLTAAITLVNS